MGVAAAARDNGESKEREKDGSRNDREQRDVLERTVLRILNMDEKFRINEISTNTLNTLNTFPGHDDDSRRALDTAAAVRFEVLNVDNSSVERHPKICLNVVELRVALAMRFLRFVEVNDRL